LTTLKKKHSFIGLLAKGAVILVGVAFLQAILGELFYKSHVGPIYLTGLALLLLTSWFILLSFARFRVPAFPYIYNLILIIAVYLLVSLFLDRDLYWVSRQGIFILYMMASLFSFAWFYKGNFNGIDKFFRFCTYFGAIFMFIHLVLPFVPGHADFTSMLIFLFGYSYLICSRRSLKQRVIIAILSCLFVGSISSHTAFVIAPAAIAWMDIFLGYKKLRFPLVLLALLAILGVVIMSKGLVDPNAVWRYLYWEGVIEESWSRGFFMIGKGFGVTFMPKDSPFFTLLIEQVSSTQNRDYQLMTVPPHNGLLTILIYVGLPGVIIFLLPYWQAFKFNLKKKQNNVERAVFLASLGMLLLLVSNQFLLVPYAALTFWLTYGAMLAFLAKRRLRVNHNMIGQGSNYVSNR